MADPEDIAGRVDPQEAEGGRSAFFGRLAVSEISYSATVDGAVNHAAAVRPVPAVAVPAWRNIGPRNVAGRVIAFAQHRANPLVVYAGTAHGGLWRTVDGGDTWEHLGTPRENFPISTIAIPDEDPTVLYVGTGAPVNRYPGGVGLFKVSVPSATSPAVFQYPPLASSDPPFTAPAAASPGAAERYTRIRMDPFDPKRLWAASQTGLWRFDEGAPPVREFPPPPAGLGFTPPALAAGPVPPPGDFNAWPNYATDLLVAADPRSTDTVARADGKTVPRHLIVLLAIDGLADPRQPGGVFRGRFDRSNAAAGIAWEQRLNVPNPPLPANVGFGRIRLAQCASVPNHVYAVMQGRHIADVTLVVTTAGAVGAAQFTFQIGTGAVVGPQATAASFAVPGTFHVLRFGAGAYVAGDSWTLVAGGAVFPTAGNASVGVVSVLSGEDFATAVFYSPDSGNNWAAKGTIPLSANTNDLTNGGGQSDYDLLLEVNADHPEKVLCGSIELCYSDDFAATWKQLENWQFYDVGDHTQHADQHIGMFDIADRYMVWSGNDGGLVLASDVTAIPAPQTFWRKRSHGIIAGQFQDITVHPTLTFMTGGGLQDNGSWIGFGGPTWYRVDGADGGELAFNSGDPRQSFPTWQNNVDFATILANAQPPFVLPAGGFWVVSPMIPDLPIGNMEVRSDTYAMPGSGPFVMFCKEHPLVPGQILISGVAGGGGRRVAYWGGTPPLSAAIPANGVAVASPAVNPLRAPGGAAIAALPRVATSTVAFGPVLAGVQNPLGNASVNGWIGTTDGNLFFTSDARDTTPPAPAFPPPPALMPYPPHLLGWVNPPTRVPSPNVLRQVVTGIAVHPNDPRIVAVSVNPNLTDAVFVTIVAGGAVGAATFTYQVGSSPAVIGPLATAALVVLQGTPIALQFQPGVAPNTFAVGEIWTVRAGGAVIQTTTNGSSATLAGSDTLGQTITIAIATPGVVGTSQFTFQIGGAAVSAPQLTTAQFPIPSTLTAVFFTAGNYVVGSRWTISPTGVVTSTGAAGSPLPTAIVRDGGHVYITYDRGTSWTDITQPTAPQPRPNPDLNALPPGPISCLCWEPTPNPTALFAGTLAGVYVIRSLPAPVQAPNGLALTPAAGTSIRPGGPPNPLQMRAALTLTSGGGPFDCTADVDWSSANPAQVAVSATGLVTGVAAGGPVNITARRGPLTRTIPITVNAGAPATPAPPAAAAPPQPAIVIDWRPFSIGVAGQEALPLTLINDITTVGTRLRVATFGRGIWECELSTAPAQPKFRLFIRHTVIEEGLIYPRPALPAALPDDPRVPPGSALDSTHAFDIRVDPPPYKFFEDRVDGVEFDQELGVGPAVPRERNIVYVQVHNSGWADVVDVVVHLYFMVTPAAAHPTPGVAPCQALPTAPPGHPLPVLEPVADFYNPPSFDIRTPPPAPNWQRVGPAQPIGRVRPAQPAVARFDWVPDVTLAQRDVALLALCTAPSDQLPAAPVPANIGALLQNERRAALRIVHVSPLPPADLYIRDGVEDDGRNGSVAFTGRSPDIIVVQTNAGPTPEQTFRDLLDVRPQSRIKGSVPNFVYVRVHNRRAFDIQARVELWAVPFDPNNTPHAAPAGWVPLYPPAGPPQPPLLVPAKNWALQGVTWTNPPDPNPSDESYKGWVLVALVNSNDNVDAKPQTARIDSLDTFWKFFGRFGDSDNAASRALPYDK